MTTEFIALKTVAATPPRVVVVIPIKNEAPIIERTVEDILRALGPLSVAAGIVCVDDGSTDDTWTVLTQLADRHREVTAVRLSRNFGHDPALFAGMQIADADAVITMDADGQHPALALPEFIRIWREAGCHIVHGIKRVRGDESRRRSWPARAVNGMLGEALKQDMTNATEFKLLDRAAVSALLACSDRNVFYRALASWIGFTQATCEFDVQPSLRGGSSWNLAGLIRFALNGLVTFSDLPLRVLFLLGAVSIVGSGLLLAKVLVVWLLSEVEPGYTTLLVMMLLNLGFVMIGLSVVGLYVRTTMLQTMGRPRSIIQEIHGGHVRD